MHVPCQDIARDLTLSLQSRVTALAREGKVPKLVTILTGSSSDQLSYVQMKRSVAQEIGVSFEFMHYPDQPLPQDFLQIVHEQSTRPDLTGILIQLPLPRSYDIRAIYDAVSAAKDIEGHHPESPYMFPLVQACLVGLHWIHSHDTGIVFERKLPAHASPQLVAWLQDRAIVIAGRGLTTGSPIARYLDRLHVAYQQTDSKTPDPDALYRQADIIITGVGKRIITKQSIKEGVVLLNFGLHNEPRTDTAGRHRILMGDYDEDEIRDTASWYTTTPGGLGPIDILCLYGNLIDACEKS